LKTPSFSLLAGASLTSKNIRYQDALNENIQLRDERKRMDIELYLLKKSYREIAKELKISVRDISIIINEFENNNNPIPKKSKTAKAFEMFKDGKSPVEVVIALDLQPYEVETFYGYIALKIRKCGFTLAI
jgi:hypothetical protein